MNKGDLIDALSEELEISKTAAGNTVNLVFDSIKKSLATGNNVSIGGFGSFAVKARKARVGRNPQTGDPIQIPASNAVGFKAGKALKDAVN